MDAVVGAMGGRVRPATVGGPLGDPVEAAYGLVHDGQGSGADTATAGFGADDGAEEYVVIVITGMDDERADKVPIRVSLRTGKNPFDKGG